MIYSDCSIVTPSGNKTLLTSVGQKTFDAQSDFQTSTITLHTPRDYAQQVGLTEGVFVSTSVDDYTLPTPYVIESSSWDFVSDDGIPMVEFKGRSIHALGEDAVVLPSAWPNPAPSGHAFQNATAGTILKTLIARAQERNTLLQWDASSFSGTVDSNGVTWPAMADRTYNNGDTLLSVCKALVDEGLVELAFDSFKLKAYVPGTLGKVVPPEKVLFRPGYSLSEGSSERDASEFATDIFAIGEGTAVAFETRPALYSVLGRRRVKFVQYGGISNKDLLGVLAKSDLDRMAVVKQEDSLAVPHTVYQPFTDYSLGDWVTLDRGDGTSTSVKIKQISIQEGQDGAFTVGVSLGSLLDSAEEKIQRRLDAITGANAGGGAVPNDKATIKLAPSKPINLSVTAQPYLDNQQRRKVIAMADWSDVLTYSNGTPLRDIDHYEVSTKAGNATDYSAAQVVESSSAVFSGYDPDTKFQFRVRAFIDGLASPWVESTVTTLIDNTPIVLSKPSTPKVSARWQTLSVVWDGKNADGTWPSLDTLGVEVHLYTVSTFTPSTSTYAGLIQLIPGSRVGGSLVLPNLEPKVTYYVKLVPIGKQGTPGTSSDSASATTADLAVTPEQVAAINSDLSKAKSDLYNPGGAVDLIKTTLTGQIKDGDAMVLSKGTDLVVNGTGYLGNNTNFSSVTYTPDGPQGMPGAFVATGNKNVFMSDQYIPIDPSKKYVGSVQIKELTNKGNAQFYVGLACFDSAGYQIDPRCYAHVGAGNTTLAAPLKKGDTVVSLTSVANWRTLDGSLGVWNYIDPKGRVWPVGTYTRWFAALDSIDATANTVTLKTPWPFGDLPAGHPVGNMIAGGTYLYNFGMGLAPADWKTYRSAQVITGIHDGSTSAAAVFAFPQGTTSVKVVCLANYPPSDGATTAFAAISLSDTAAAQFQADKATSDAAAASTDAANAAGVASGKADVLIQSTAPVAAMQKATTLWIDTTGNTNTPKRWSGSTWVVVTDKAATDAASAAALAQSAADTAKANAAAAQATANKKISTYSSSTQPVAPPEGFVVGDLWINTADKNRPYRWSGTAWVDTRDGAISDASNTASKAVSDAAAALTAAQQAQATADGAISTYYQEAPPWADGSTQPATKLGDMWYKSSSNQAYRWDGSKWALIADTQIAAALNAAQNAQITADGKIDTFYSATRPTTGSVGDLWFDTSDKNKQYYCSSVSPLTWVSVADGRIADAQARADKAVSDAASAASVAASASGVAGSKADVLIQATAPSTEMQKATTLWIDTSNAANTPKRWDGSAWVAITDKTAIDAAAAAVAAQSAAQAAQDAANNAQKSADSAIYKADIAQMTANGKNAVFWERNAPSDTNNPGKAWGDVWYQYTIADNKTQILGQWYWYNRWVSTALSETFLPLVNIGVGTYGELDGLRLKAQSVQADKVLVQGSVGTTLIADGAITTDKLIAGVITADKLGANSITTVALAAQSITGDKINAQSVGGAVGDFVLLKAENIKSGNITATLGIATLGGIIAGPQTGAHAEMTATGFRAYSAPVDESGTPVLSVQLGTGGDDIISVTDSTGTETASVTSSGSASFNDVTTNNDLSVSGTPLIGKLLDPASDTGWLDQLARGVIAQGDTRSYMSTAGKLPTGDIPVAILGFTMDWRRAYRISLLANYDVSDVSGVGRVSMNLKYEWSSSSTDPEEPTASSGFVNNDVRAYTSNVTNVTQLFDFVWSPANYGTSDGLVSIKVLFGVYTGGCQITPLAGGSGTWRLMVEDLGTRVDDTARKVLPKTSGTSNTTPAKKSYTSVWTASDSWTFYGNGNRDSYRRSEGITRAGYWNSISGDMKTMCVFNNNATSGETTKPMSSALSGASITKAEVYIQTVHWYDSNGGPMFIRQATGSSIPSTLSDATAKSGSMVQKNFTTRNQGFWVTVPTSWFSSSNRAVYFGPANSTWQHTYCHIASHSHSNTGYRPKVRLTYTR